MNFQMNENGEVIVLGLPEDMNNNLLEAQADYEPRFANYVACGSDNDLTINVICD